MSFIFIFIKLIETLRTLETDISKSNQSRQGIREEILQRLIELEMRVPGLREILADLRSRVDERPSVTTLSLTPTVAPARPVSPLTSAADASMSAKLNEIEEIITRCRMACSDSYGFDTQDEQFRKIDYRLAAVCFATNKVPLVDSNLNKYIIVYF